MTILDIDSPWLAFLALPFLIISKYINSYHRLKETDVHEGLFITLFFLLRTYLMFENADARR